MVSRYEAFGNRNWLGTDDQGRDVLARVIYGTRLSLLFGLILTALASIIGVTAGLLIFNQPFGFMALLGVMSLSGMLIKNAIVLIDQIDLEIREGKDRFQAIVDSGVSRMKPVSMAALTTIMGMIPLLQDGFFVAMAVTIMFGLSFAAVLTLVVVPVLYAIFFRIHYGGEVAIKP